MNEEMEAVVASITEAFDRHDAEAVARHWTEDAYGLPPDGPLVEGRPGIAAIVNATYAAGVQSMRFETVATRESGDFLVQVGRYVMTIAAEGQSFEDDGKFVSVYARQPDGSLLINVTSFSRDAPPAG